MKDFFGHELAVGDIVAFNAPIYSGLTEGIIIKFTLKGCKVKYGPTGFQSNEITTAFQVVKKHLTN